MKNLYVGKDNRHLVDEDNQPFFWLGDTAWELFHKLSFEEAKFYLENRKAKGFNVIQAVALAELEGLETPNYYGRFPLLKDENGNYNPLKPDLTGENNYWDHVEKIINLANSMDMYIAFLPTWGDKFNLMHGKGPVIFNPENARLYGEWIANYFSKYNNIIWVMGGDRLLLTFEHFGVVREMAKSIKRVNKDNLVTLHPYGCQSSSLNLHNEDWLDFNMVQSGHCRVNEPNYSMVLADLALTPPKPSFDAEPRYEDHPIHFNSDNGFFDDFDIRQAAYWNVFTGAMGHTYGHCSIWNFAPEPNSYSVMSWQDAMDRKGASQMKHLKNLMDSINIMGSASFNEMIVDNPPLANHIQCLKGDNFAFAYTPYGIGFKVDLTLFPFGNITASWFDPRTGETTMIGSYKNDQIAFFSPKTHGRNDDWVLKLEW